MYLRSVAVDHLQNCSLEHFLCFLVYMDTVAVVRPEYSGQGELKDPSVSVDREEVGEGEGSLLGGDLSVLRPVEVTAPAPTVNILRAGPAVSSLSSHWSSGLVILCSHWMKYTW